MASEDDAQPLFHRDEELTEQCIRITPEFEQVVYGFKKCRWRTVLVNVTSVLTCGIPFLVFHWCPTWFLNTTHVRCCFQDADQVIVVETYRKKRKYCYVHNIIDTRFSSVSLHDFGGEQELDMADEFHTPIHLEDGSTLNAHNFRFFRHKYQTLIWDPSRTVWSRLVGIECGATCAQLQAMGDRAPSSEERKRWLNLYGLNEMKVPVQSVMRLVLVEVCNPCYAIQLFTIAVWLADGYYYYCVAVILMTTFGVATSVILTKKSQENLRATVEAHDSVEVWGGGTAAVDSRRVCPGDVVVLPARGCTLHADLVLLTGAAVLNESMLTGESVPVTKTALQRVDKPFDMKQHASNILFCGTKVIQTRYYNNEPVKALVLRTGYNTRKGQLVRSILYPVPDDMRLDRDSYKFIMMLAFSAMVGLICTMALKAYREPSPGNVALNALDIISIAIPPALPTAMTVGRLYAVSRLKRARISCLNNRAVNVSGSLDCICFDKTGTLTEDGLDMWGVVPMSAVTSPPRLGRAQRDPRLLNDLHDLKIGMAVCHSLTLLDAQLAGDPLDLKMFESTGWTLEESDVAGTSNNEILTVVKSKNIANVDVDDNHMPLEVGIVQQHQFVSSLQRSSVVARLLGEDVLRVYCKGAPEVLGTLCTPATVPENLNEVLSSYAAKGYRVLAMSTRVIEATCQQLQRMTRDEVERNLEFLGLVILENRLKGVTTGVIKELNAANIHVAMITGDNIHTAVSVAKECGILCSGERVVQLHVDTAGNTPIVYCESTLHGVPVGRRTVLQRSLLSVDSGHGSLGDTASASGSGFRSHLDPGTGSNSRHGSGSGTTLGSGSLDEEARAGEPRYKIVMSGDTWRVLREHYPHMVGAVAERGAVFARMSSDQKQQLIVEYQALGYYVGMCGDGANDCSALRAAHAGFSLSKLESSVAAPFTSHIPDIECVSRILHEGRAALTTSFGIFKFMFAYSLTKFFSVTFLYYFDSDLTDIQFLYIDVGLIINFVFFFGNTKAYTGQLSKIPPLTSLLGLIPLFSLVGQIVLIGVTQYLCYYILTLFPWYVRNRSKANFCWENYSIYAVSMFQYIILALLYNSGSPYRRSVVTNKPFMIIVLLMSCMSIHIAVWPEDYLAEFLQLKIPNDALMSYLVLVLAFLNFIVALLFERVIIEHLMERKQMIPEFLREKRVRKTPHLMIKRQLTEMDYFDCDSKKYEENGTSDLNSGRES